VWKKVDPDTIVMAYVPLIEAIPVIDDYVRASGWVLVQFDRVFENGQEGTNMSYKSQYNFGGRVPSTFVNSQLASRLMFLEDVRIKFDKSLSIDGSNRDAFITKMKQRQEYSVDENKMIIAGLLRLTEFDKLQNKKEVEAASPLATSEIAQKKGERIAYGKASTIVRASPQQIIAYQWDFMARHSQTAETIKKQVVEELNVHNKLVYMVKVIPNPFQNRDLVMRLLWKKMDDTNNNKNYVFVITPETLLGILGEPE